jgi:ribosomal protein S27E
MNPALFKGINIGKHPQYNYIWQPCKICGKERWVIFSGGKPRSVMCRQCASRIGTEAVKGTTQTQETKDLRQATRSRNHPKHYVNCAGCGKSIYRIPCRIREHNYCSSLCQINYEYKTGMRDPNTITIEARKASQKLIQNGTHPFLLSENRIKGQRELGRRHFGKSWLEERMGYALNKAGVIFEKQYPIKKGVDLLGRDNYYFVDFAVLDMKIAIECDGVAWHTDKNKDDLRQVYIESQGWQVIRFTENEINSNVLSCVNKVKDLLPV